MCAGSSGRVDGEQQALEVAMQVIEDSQLNITCTECSAMLSALQGFCKQHQVSSSRMESYQAACRRQSIPVATDYTTLPQKCDAFHGFIAALYCPLDPCVQITQAMQKAPSALCDLMHCRHTPAEAAFSQSRVVVPLACPAYLEAIVGHCQTKPADVPLAKDMCAPYPDRFEREGCALVLDRVFAASLPLDFCGAAFCGAIPPTEYARYCREVLHLPAREPVPVPGYLAWRNGTAPTAVPDCVAPPGIVITVKSATYGTNCSALTDNILEGLKARCNGRRECTFGNADLGNASSAWNPARAAGINVTCSRDFEIIYTCSAGGPEYRVVADYVAAFQARPFDCIEELKFKTSQVLPDDKLAETIVPTVRRDVVAI